MEIYDKSSRKHPYRTDVATRRRNAKKRREKIREPCAREAIANNKVNCMHARVKTACRVHIT